MREEGEEWGLSPNCPRLDLVLNTAESSVYNDVPVRLKHLFWGLLCQDLTMLI